MLTCPHCTQKISAEMVTCPSCRKPLKAFGHPGIPLHYADSTEYLCDRCLYHQDDTCTFPQRPYAQTCTLYQDASEEFKPDSVAKKPLKYWLNKYKGLLLLSILLLLSLILTLTAN
ncbi:MAG: zinc ribbon domain-containing protein [Gloeocapsa sp. DLM2.Bin57]|nr:MAG: zinc ribbon domain-containing protein [Gloeocapsa sp. DLM2.Bin57]